MDRDNLRKVLLQMCRGLRDESSLYTVFFDHKPEELAKLASRAREMYETKGKAGIMDMQID